MASKIPADQRNEHLRNLVMTRYAAARADSVGHHALMADRYHLWRSWWGGRFHPFRNNLSVGYMFSIIQSIVAKKVVATFGQAPYVTFAGDSGDDGPTSRVQTVTVNSQWQDFEAPMKAIQLYTQSELYGTGVAQYGWRFDKIPMQGNDRTTGDIVRGEVTTFDGPDLVIHDSMDCFPQPGHGRIDDMDWFIVRKWIEWESLQEEARQGYYIKSEVEKLGKSSMNPSPHMHGDYHGNRIDTGKEKGMRQPVELIEMWGRVPNELVKRGGIPDRVVVVANGQYVIRDDNNPFWSRQRLPFLQCSSTLDPHYFWAPGRMEIGEKQQLAINRYESQKADVLDLVADPMLVVDEDKILNLNDIVMQPGGVIRTRGGTGTDVINTLGFNLAGLDRLTPESASLFQQLQQSTGASEDQLMGSAISKRQTKAEFLGRGSQVATRIKLEVLLHEWMVWQRLGTRTIEMNRQFLTDDRYFRIAGASAYVDPVTGQQVPAASFARREDLIPDYDARCYGASNLEGPDAKMASWAQFVNLAAINPAAATEVNWAQLLRRIALDSNKQHVDDFMNPTPLQRQMNQSLLGGGGGPEEGLSLVS